ncbi:unnamed protein product [Rotaria sp. Silwood2]|nr:unnamed protein product [Rotaria sp. Silwood2]
MQKNNYDIADNPSAVRKNNNNNDTSTAHRKLFCHLESDDASMNALFIRQLRVDLVDEQFHRKFVQIFQFIFRNSRKFSKVSLDKWAILITKNRGKIFSNDAQCDQ